MPRFVMLVANVAAILTAVSAAAPPVQQSDAERPSVVQGAADGKLPEELELRCSIVVIDANTLRDAGDADARGSSTSEEDLGKLIDTLRSKQLLASETVMKLPADLGRHAYAYERHNMVHSAIDDSLQDAEAIETWWHVLPTRWSGRELSLEVHARQTSFRRDDTDQSLTAVDTNVTVGLSKPTMLGGLTVNSGGRETKTMILIEAQRVATRKASNRCSDK
jgi:hypothetical protein